MRVLHVVASAQRRGAEVFASDLVGALDGVEQRVAILREAVGPTVHFSAPIDLLGANGGRGPLSMPAVRALRRLFRSWRPDVVQAHGGEPLKYAIAARGISGGALVYRRIGSAHGYSDRPLARIGYGRLMRLATVTVAVADAVRLQTIETFGLPASSIVAIPNAVDGARLRPTVGRVVTRKGLGVAPGARVILSLGAFTWEKDPVGLLGIAERVMRDRPDVVCLLAGDGPLRGDVETFVQERNLRDRVLLLGSRSDVADLLSASDVVLLASATEGMPAALIEAGMAGVPVASYDLGGIGEVVVDGDTGVLARAFDAEQLSAGLAALLDDEAARERMGIAAKTRCLETFDVAVVASRYRSLYEDVIAR